MTNKTRLFIADTMAMVLFSFATGMAIELLIAGLTFIQSLTSRIVAIPMNLVTARPYGLYRDIVMSRMQTENKYFKGGIDIMIFTSFQVPVYVFVLLISGANFEQILKACTSVILFFVILGRPYGVFLDYCRKLLNVEEEAIN